MDVLGLLLVGIGVLALIGIGVAAYLLKDRGGAWKWIVGALGAIAAIVLGLVFLGRRKKPTVIEVKGHERTVAPTEEEKVRLDVKSEEVKQKAEELQEESVALDKKAENLDAEKTKLEEQAKETDQKLEELETKAPDSAPSDRKPDRSISDRVRRS